MSTSFDPLEPAPQQAPKSYDAFISYSHAADGTFAPSLQNGLQKLTKSWRQRRALEVFRDETGLSVNPALWDGICSALDGAQYFVLLCSVESASSEWVGREIQRWVALKGTDSIILVITDGTWAWDGVANDFDLTRSSAIHPALAGAFTSPPDPIDMSWAKGELTLSLDNARFREELARVAAPLHGRAPTEVVAEHEHQQRRTRRLARGATTLLATLTITAVIASVLAIANQRQASAERSRAEKSRQVAQTRAREATSQELSIRAREAAANKGDLGLLLATQAYRYDQSDEARATLESLLDSDVTRYLQGGSGGITDVEFSADGSMVAAADSDGHLLAWNTKTGRPLFDPIPGDVNDVAWSGDNKTIMAADLNDEIRFYTPTGEVDGKPLETGHTPSVVEESIEWGPACFKMSERIARRCPDDGRLAIRADLSPSGELVLLAVGNRRLEVWDRSTGKKVPGLSITADTGLERFADDSDTIINHREKIDARTGKVTARPRSSNTQSCPMAYDQHGPQVFEPKTAKWTVADLRKLYTVAYEPAQGTAENPQLWCFPDRVQLDVTLTAPARVIDSAASGTIVVGTDQPAPVEVIPGGVKGSGDLPADACAVAGRNLTQTEWHQYIPDRDYERTCPDFPKPTTKHSRVDASVPPSDADVRAALRPAGLTYLGPCTSLGGDTPGQWACGTSIGADDDENVYELTIRDSSQTTYVHLMLKNGRWVLDESVGSDDGARPKWFTRLVDDK